MTPDQIYAIKRVLMLPPQELLQLRKDIARHDDALTRIQHVLAMHRSTNADALDAMTKLHDDIQHREAMP